MDKEISKYNELVREKFPQIVYLEGSCYRGTQKGEFKVIKSLIDQYKFRSNIVETIDRLNKTLENIGLEKVKMDIDKVLRVWKKAGIYSTNLLQTTVKIKGEMQYGVELRELVPYDKLFADAHGGMSEEEYKEKEKAKKEKEAMDAYYRAYAVRLGKEDKKASTVGRAVVGGIVAGPVGAIVGAASAIEKNNKDR